MALYKHNADTFGPITCNNASNQEYDAGGAFFALGGLLGTSSYNACGESVLGPYRVAVLAHGAPQGFQVFTDGLAKDRALTSNPDDLTAYQLIYNNEHWMAAPGSANAAYNDNLTPGDICPSGLDPVTHKCGWMAAGYTYQGDASHQRETALAIMALLNSPRFGIARDSARLTRDYNYLQGHFRQNFTENTVPYHKTFMLAIMVIALDRYDDAIGTNNISWVTTTADYLWAHLWDTTTQAFVYTDDTCTSNAACPGRGDWGGMQNTPFDNCPNAQCTNKDLNLMIYAIFARAAEKTGIQKYKDEALAIFTSGVNYTGTLSSQKQFGQNYLWPPEAIEMYTPQ